MASSDGDFWSQSWLEAFEPYTTPQALGHAVSASREDNFKVCFWGADGIKGTHEVGNRRTEVLLRYSRYSKGKNYEAFLDELAKRPDLVGPILNGKLPQGVAALCDKHEVEFLPKNDKAFVVSCACKEGSKKGFCRHMDMLVQWMADAIRTEPVKLFELRGINLIEGLRARGIEAKEAKVTCPTISEVMEGVGAQMVELTDDDRDGRSQEQLLRSIPFILLDEAAVKPETFLPGKVTFSNQADYGAWVATLRTRAGRWWQKLQKSALDIHAMTAMVTDAKVRDDEDVTEDDVELLKARAAAKEAVRQKRAAFELELRAALPTAEPLLRSITRCKIYPISAYDDDYSASVEDYEYFLENAPIYEKPGAVRALTDADIGLEESAGLRLAKRVGRWRPGVLNVKLQPAFTPDAREVQVRVKDIVAELVPEDPAGVADFMRLYEDVPFPHYIAGLLGFTDAQAHELDPVDEAWRTAALTAAYLVADGWTIPVPANLAASSADGVEHEGYTRILWVPAMEDPAVKVVVSQLAEGIAPVAAKMFALDDERGRQSIAAFEKTSGFGFNRMACAWALVHAAGAVIRIGNAKELVPKASFGELVVLQEPFRSLDGKNKLDQSEALFQAFQPMIASKLMNFTPVVVLDMQTKKSRKKTGPKENAEFGLTFAVRNHVDAVEAKMPMPPLEMIADIVREKKLSSRAIEVMQALEVVSRIAPVLVPLGANPKKPVPIGTDGVGTFLVKTIPLLRMFGIGVVLPDSLKQLVRPRLVAQIGVKGSSRNLKSYLTKDALTEFGWSVRLGDELVNEEDFLKLSEMKGSIVPVGNTFVYLDAEMVDELLAQLKRLKKPDAFDRFRAVLMGSMEGAEVEVSESVREMAAKLLELPDRPVPESISATLRPYQKRGYVWLMKNIDLGLGSLIADDMGLGKTLQVICAVAQMKAEGKLTHQALVVAPTVLLTNWTREIRKFAPGLSARIVHGTSRRWDMVGKEGKTDKMADVLLTSYGVVRSDANELRSRKFSLLIVDEAQAVKNHLTGQAKAVRGLKADHIIAMTGTPVENRLMEYWSILDLVQPKLLGPAAEFQRHIATPIEVDHDPERLSQFRKLTAPFMIRRTKTDKKVIADLPEKSSIDIFTELTERQKSLYKTAVDMAFKEIDQIEDEANAEKIEKGLAKNALSNEMRRRGRILKLIGQLKAICNTPAQFADENPTSPDCGKGESLLQLLGQLHAAERKVIIFTQFRKMGELLQSWIEHATGQRPDLLHGGISRNGRQQMVDRFQEDRSVRAIIVSLKAGGTGLNLTAASAVVHYDLWWNPAVETQATDRAYRIGQRRGVLVYRFVTAGSFEERINAMLEEKRELADLTVSTGETWIGDLPESDLRAFLALSDGAETSSLVSDNESKEYL